MSKLVFDHEYYERLVKEYGYDHVRLGEISFGLGLMSADEIRSRWVCHCDADKFSFDDQSQSIVTTGVGLSGVP